MESKIEATRRLQREGRWETAGDFRQKMRKQLRKAGMKRAEANEAAWRRTIERFPPLNAVTREQPTPKQETIEIPPVNLGICLRSCEAENRELAALVQRVGVSDRLFSDDLDWAHAHYDLDVTPAQAPDVVAWILLKIAREDRSRFYLLYFDDYCLRHGHKIQRCPITTEWEAALQRQLFDNLHYLKAIAMTDDDGRRRGEERGIWKMWHDVVVQARGGNAAVGGSMTQSSRRTEQPL